MAEGHVPEAQSRDNLWTVSVDMKPSVVRLMSQAIEVLDKAITSRVLVLDGYHVDFDQIISDDRPITQETQDIFDSTMRLYRSAIRELNDWGHSHLQSARAKGVIPESEIETREALLPQIVRRYSARCDTLRQAFVRRGMGFRVRSVQTHVKPAEPKRYIDEEGYVFIIDENGQRAYPMC